MKALITGVCIKHCQPQRSGKQYHRVLLLQVDITCKPIGQVNAAEPGSVAASCSYMPRMMRESLADNVDNLTRGFRATNYVQFDTEKRTGIFDAVVSGGREYGGEILLASFPDHISLGTVLSVPR